jgi:hypothetical protein
MNKKLLSKQLYQQLLFTSLWDNLRRVSPLIGMKMNKKRFL